MSHRLEKQQIVLYLRTYAFNSNRSKRLQRKLHNKTEDIKGNMRWS
jgi:hypothetical protein